MKTTLLLGILSLALAVPAFAQQQPSAKATAKTSALTLIPKTNGNGQFQTVLVNKIKTANQKSLFVNVSMEIGLFTKTTISSKNGVDDTSVGQAEIDVRVLLDGKEIEPGQVVFGRRTQTLNAALEGNIGACLVTTTNLDGSFSTIVNLSCVTPETIGLILDSLQATSFNFVAPEVSEGVHTISVQAKIDTIGSAQFGSFSAIGFVGKGSFTCESVRLIKGEDVIDVP